MMPLTLPVLVNAMTVVDAMAKLREYDSRAGVRPTGVERFEVLTAADLAATIDGKVNWKAVRVLDVPQTKYTITPFRVNLEEFPAAFEQRKEVDFAFPAKQEGWIRFADKTGAAAAAPAPETLLVVTRSERLWEPILLAARICRCREANHDVPPKYCKYDGSEVDCT
jgi:hypothetical protein